LAPKSQKGDFVNDEMKRQETEVAAEAEKPPREKAIAQIDTRSKPPPAAGAAQSSRRPGEWFKPGESGNPKGRPIGARNKLSEAFLADLFNDWQQNGKSAITAVCKQSPVAYVRIVASLMRKELNVKVSEWHELSDAELDRRIAIIAAALAEGRDSLSLEGEDPAAPALPAGKLPPIH
jgi:hypothetical protein